MIKNYIKKDIFISCGDFNIKKLICDYIGNDYKKKLKPYIYHNKIIYYDLNNNIIEFQMKWERIMVNILNYKGKNFTKITSKYLRYLIKNKQPDDKIIHILEYVKNSIILIQIDS